MSRRIGLAIEHLKPAGDYHEEVVEVVRDAASELPDRFDLLRVAQK